MTYCSALKYAETLKGKAVVAAIYVIHDFNFFLFMILYRRISRM